MTKQALGKGVEALFSEPVSVSQGVAGVPVKEIVPNRYQPRTRFDKADLDELAKTIAAKGVLQPITVKRRAQGGYELVAGERRWRAAQAAGLQTIPALVLDNITERDQLEYALIENLQRKDLNGIEAARAYQRLMKEFKLSQADVSERVGKERSSVANTLRLLTLPREIQEDIERGRISPGHAKALLGVATREEQLALWQKILHDSLSVRETESVARPRRATAVRRRRPAEVQDAEAKLQGHLGTRVRIQMRPKGRGAIMIEYYSAEELERVVELILPTGQKAKG